MEQSVLDETIIELPLGFLADGCDDWNALCNELGLNPWIFNEGLATRDDLQSITLGQCRKHCVTL